MALTLPNEYNASTRTALQNADARNQKKDEAFVPPRFIMTDTANGKQYVMTLTSGALVFTLV